MRSSSSFRGGSDASPKRFRLSKRLLEVAEEFESTYKAERDRYEAANRTLHEKIASLRTSVELEKTRSKRQQELIDALQQQLRDSQLVGNLQSKERLLEQGKLLNEMESLRKEVMALRFQALNQTEVVDKASPLDDENHDPNFNNPPKSKGKSSYRDRLIRAAGEGDLEVVRQLLNPGKEIVARALDSYRETLSRALVKAAGGTSVVDVSSAASDTVSLLLTCGASPFSDAVEWNAVHQACASGNDKILEKLLAFGSNELAYHLEDRTPESLTALHIAAQSGHPKCIRLLLRHGADIAATDGEGRTPIDLVEDETDVDSKPETDDECGEGTIAPSKARAVLDTLNDFGTLFWSHSVRANRLYGLEDYEGARLAYNEAINLTESLSERVTSDANRATLFYNSARACVKVGRHTEAIERCTSAVELRDGCYPNALSQRAASYMSLFDYKRAIQDYQELLQQATGNDADDWRSYLSRAMDLAAKAEDHYLCLGVAPDATPQQIKQAFRKQCLKWHPDKHRDGEDDSARASIMFKAINEANEVLSNEQKRTLYDIDRISKRMDDIVRRQHEEQQQWQSSSSSGASRGESSYFRAHQRHQRRRSNNNSMDVDDHSSVGTTSPDEDDIHFAEDLDDDDDDSYFDEDEEEIFADDHIPKYSKGRTAFSGASREYFPGRASAERKV